MEQTEEDRQEDARWNAVGPPLIFGLVFLPLLMVLGGVSPLIAATTFTLLGVAGIIGVLAVPRRRDDKVQR